MERQVTCIDFMCRVKHCPKGLTSLSPYEQGQNLNERPYEMLTQNSDISNTTKLSLHVKHEV